MTDERRWNGWGDARVQEELKPEARAFLVQAIGEPQPMLDATDRKSTRLNSSHSS